MKLIVIAITSLLLFFPSYWLFESVVGPDWGAGIAAVGMYIMLPVLMLSIWESSEEKVTDDIMSISLQNGNLCSDDYKIFSAFVVEDPGFADLHYLLDIGEGKTLSLKGQYLYGPVESGAFPSSSVRVFWDKESSFTCGVQCMGNSIVPVRVIQTQTDDDSILERYLNDREVFNQPIEYVVQILENRG